MTVGLGTWFEADLQAFALAAKAQAIQIARASIQEVAYEVVYYTPVMTGFMRASWQPSIDVPPSAPPGGGKRATSVSWDDAIPEIPVQVVIAQVTLAIAQIQPGQTFYLVNNAAYAMRINYGFSGKDAAGRHYSQRGQFFVERAVGRWPQIVAGQVALMNGSKSP